MHIEGCSSRLVIGQFMLELRTTQLVYEKQMLVELPRGPTNKIWRSCIDVEGNLHFPG